MEALSVLGLTKKIMQVLSIQYVCTFEYVLESGFALTCHNKTSKMHVRRTLLIKLELLPEKWRGTFEC